MEEDLEDLMDYHQDKLEQQILEVEVVELLINQIVEPEVRVDQVLLLSEHQDQQVHLYLYHQEQTQKQHYPHQLEDVLLRHSRFLERLQLASNSST